MKRVRDRYRGGLTMGLRRIATCAMLCVLAVWLVAAGCGGGGTGGRAITVEGPVELNRSFEEGASFKYLFKVTGESAVAMQGYDRVVSTNTEFRTSNTVTSVTDDEVKLEMRFDSAASSISMEDNVMPNEGVAELRGKSLEFTLDRDGKVISFAGLGGSRYLEEGAGEMGMLLYSLYPTLPDEPVSVGYTWEEDIDIPDITSSVDREFIGTGTYTVIGYKEKYGIACVEVATTSTFIFEGKAEQSGDIWLMSGEGTSEGVILISMDNGMVLAGVSDTTLDLEGEGSTTAGAGASTTVSMGMKIHSEMELL